MIISHQKKFIFIHIWKSAGSSITIALDNYNDNGPRDLSMENNYNKPYQEKKFPFHVFARYVKDQLPEEVYNSYFKFTFVRNPWDLQVSMYHYFLSNPREGFHELAKSKTFEEYLEWLSAGNPSGQSAFIEDHDGSIIVDYIGKFENLSKDFSFICSQIGVDATLDHLNKTIHNDYGKKYHCYYNNKTRKIVEKTFQKDIELFKYSF